MTPDQRSTLDPENWSQLEVILGTHLLADICGPFDDGVEPKRLELLTELVTRLRRRYDNQGVRVWFAQARIKGTSPREILSGAWHPSDDSVRALVEAVESPM